MSKSFSAFTASKLYRALRFGTHTYIVSVLTPADFHHSWAIFDFWPKILGRGAQAESFSEHLFHLLFFMRTQNLVHTSRRWHNTSSLTFIATGSLWPTLWPKHSEGGISGLITLFTCYRRVSQSCPKCLEVSTRKLVYTLSRLHSILSSRFNRTGSLWPTSRS